MSLNLYKFGVTWCGGIIGTSGSICLRMIKEDTSCDTASRNKSLNKVKMDKFQLFVVSLNIGIVLFAFVSPSLDELCVTDEVLDQLVLDQRTYAEWFHLLAH